MREQSNDCLTAESSMSDMRGKRTQEEVTTAFVPSVAGTSANDRVISFNERSANDDFFQDLPFRPRLGPAGRDAINNFVPLPQGQPLGAAWDDVFAVRINRARRGRHRCRTCQGHQSDALSGSRARTARGLIRRPGNQRRPVLTGKSRCSPRPFWPRRAAF